jgi:hypothetical protein
MVRLNELKNLKRKKVIKIPDPPRKNETQQAFISRCISFMTKNNEGRTPTQRAAVCYQMWRDRNKSKKGDCMSDETEEQKKFIKEGKKPSTTAHAYPEVPPMPDDYEKPKHYTEILEEEVRGDVPDRMGNFNKY